MPLGQTPLPLQKGAEILAVAGINRSLSDGSLVAGENRHASSVEPMGWSAARLNGGEQRSRGSKAE